MKIAAVFFSLLALSGCGMVWRLSYTFPATVSIEVQGQVQNPTTQASTQP